MRWKAFFYEQGSNKYIPKNYGLKGLNFSPKIKDKKNIETDFTNLLKNIKFCGTKNSFQQKFMEEIRTIKNTKETLTLVDKTSNVYKASKEQCYHKILQKCYQENT